MSKNNKSLLFFLSLIPAMQVMLAIGFLMKGIIGNSEFMILCFFISLYLLPPLLWRLFSSMIPAKMGPSTLSPDTEEVNGWFVSYQIQRIYNLLPFLEGVLKLIPGLYSSWLRLWGAKIGDNINWSSESKIIDRPFIHIGDDCRIGNEAILSAHSLEKKNDVYLLYLKEISIEANSVL